ncbi:glyoxalase [Rhodothalassium salexigens]|uniref:VOC family protein n=1 Tax=Rhodothalassium salexigens TaxID=1086 RepID=UPI0019129DD8|nr:VOC family protein [Rhodothalassium salexigens]MBK5921682.1 glyoxalase [Rhodothalassium salexigens]
MSTDPFHLAFPVDDLKAAEGFYAGLLQCAVGRRSDAWIDFNFFGHQITAHLSPDACRDVASNGVDGDRVPVRHFGVVLDWPDWEALARRLDEAGVAFLIDPHVRFEGRAGEQGTFFVRDPAGNALEFKTFRDRANLFDPGACDDHA